MTEESYIDQLVHWAKIYCKRGWKVIPLNSVFFTDDDKPECTCYKGVKCNSPGKHPRVKGWKDVATDDIKTVLRWIDRWGDELNLGIATGELSDIFVIDIDGEEGHDSFIRLEQQGNLSTAKPAIAITGSLGMHLLFKWADTGPRSNRARVLGGVDIRTDGGLIVATPSIHHSGRQYTWGELPSKLPLLPELASDFIRKLRGQPIHQSGFDFEKWILDEEPCVEGQNGSSQCMRVAAKAIRGAGIKDFETFYLKVKEWNSICEPPWSKEELQHKFESALDSWQEDGTVDIPRTETGKPISNIKTLIDILRGDPKFEGKLSYDDAISTAYFEDIPLADKDFTLIRYEMIDRYPGLAVPDGESVNAVLAVAHENSFSSVERYLRGLKWDKKNRIRDMPINAFGLTSKTEHIGLYREFMYRWFIGAVARALKPGCKLDTALIIKGPQGTLKSSFFDVLGSPWYVDSMLDLQSKDVYLNMAQSWIYEWSEMESIYSVKDKAKVKAFLSSRRDTYRAPYGRVAKPHPRRSVFVGTTNEHSMLHDNTGARRFWIIEILRRINLAYVKKCRDQLWAEAFTLYDSGKRWHLSIRYERVSDYVNEGYTDERPGVFRALEYAKQLIESRTGDREPSFQLTELERKLGANFDHNRRFQSEIVYALRGAGYRSVVRGKARLRRWVAEKTIV